MAQTVIISILIPKFRSKEKNTVDKFDSSRKIKCILFVALRKVHLNKITLVIEEESKISGFLISYLCVRLTKSSGSTLFG